VYLKVERYDTPFTNACPPGKTLKIPIAHGDGNYYTFQADLDDLNKRGRILLTYATADGLVTPQANPNGSLANIAGITNREGNILGMMPHPERAVEAILGSDDGLSMFRSLMARVRKSSTPARTDVSQPGGSEG
jgi:phosphoribosylformylglycinamidine (FGAM) synthase-like amidotransferase family enzyme